METKKEKIISQARKIIIRSTPNGIRQKELIRQIKRALPSISENTIRSCVWNLHERDPENISKEGRFFYPANRIVQEPRPRGEGTKKETRKAGLLRLISDLGEEATRKDINENLPKYWELSKEEKEIEEGVGKPKFWHKSASLCQQLKDKDGYLENPSRGVWRITKKGKEYLSSITSIGITPPPEKNKEKSFYQPFARWLETKEKNCKKAIDLGGREFGGKWETPDVIAICKSNQGSEIISAEIKINDADVITGFGQACSYKYFSHKSYLVIPKPKNKNIEDRRRVETLCKILGIGLVYFDSGNSETPNFTIKVEPIKHEQEPEKFLVDKIIDDYFKT